MLYELNENCLLVRRWQQFADGNNFCVENGLGADVNLYCISNYMYVHMSKIEYSKKKKKTLE